MLFVFLLVGLFHDDRICGKGVIVHETALEGSNCFQFVSERLTILHSKFKRALDEAMPTHNFILIKLIKLFRHQENVRSGF